jgi:hypothetical protein
LPWVVLQLRHAGAACEAEPEAMPEMEPEAACEMELGVELGQRTEAHEDERERGDGGNESGQVPSIFLSWLLPHLERTFSSVKSLR